VSFAAIILYVASQRLFIVVVAVYFVIDSVRKLLDTTSYLLSIKPTQKFKQIKLSCLFEDSLYDLTFC
jgi:hypothetical protein